MDKQSNRWLCVFLAAIGLIVVVLLAISKCTSPTTVPLGGPTPGSLEIPEPVAIEELSKVNKAEGLILAQEDADGGCLILTYNDGRFERLGKFPAIEVGKVYERQCGNQWSYSPNYLHRAVETFGHSDNEYMGAAVQPIGSTKTVNLTPAGGRASDPMIGLDNRVYFRTIMDDGSDSDGWTYATANLDGTQQEQLPDVDADRAVWLGDRWAPHARSSLLLGDAALAVEQLDERRYLIGSIGPSGTLEEGKVVALTKEMSPLAWIGDDKYVAVSYDGLDFLICTVDGVKSSIACSPLVDLAEMTAGTDVMQGSYFPTMVFCGDSVYFTVTSTDDQRSTLVGINTDSGSPSVVGALGVGQYGVQALGCV